MTLCVFSGINEFVNQGWSIKEVLLNNAGDVRSQKFLPGGTNNAIKLILATKMMMNDCSLMIVPSV